MPGEYPHIEEGERESKNEKLESICGGKPDCLYILGQGILRNPKSAERPLKSASYTARDADELMIAGKARVIAAAELAEAFPDTTLVTCSKGLMQGTSGEKTPVVHADVMAEELRHLGVDAGRIVKQDRSYSVFSELTEMVKLIAENQWGRIVILTNEYQVPRVRGMFDRMDALKDPNGESEKKEFKAALNALKETDIDVQVVAAEDVLPIRSSHYRSLIENVKQGDAWKAREAVERHGTEQLARGEYWKKLPDHFVRPEELGESDNSIEQGES